MLSVMIFLGVLLLCTSAEAATFDEWSASKGADFATSEFAIKTIPNPNCNEAAMVSTDTDCETQSSLLQKWYFATMCMNTCYGTTCADYSKIHVKCIFVEKWNTLSVYHKNVYWSGVCACPSGSNFPNQNKNIGYLKNNLMLQYWVENKCDDSNVIGNTILLSCTKCSVPFIANALQIVVGSFQAKAGDKFPVDRFLTLQCPSTHNLVGSARIFCRESGFTNIPKCVEILNCPTPSIPNAIFRNALGEELQNDTFIDSNTLFEIECAAGFALSGPRCAHCRFGVINLEAQSCNPICPIPIFDASNSLFHYEFETVINETVWEGTKLEFVCKEDYAIDGIKQTSISLQCSNGQVGSVPVCKRKCTIPPIKYLKFPHQTEIVVIGEAIRFDCERNYIYIGPEIHKCLENGDWNDTLGECRETCDTTYLDKSLIIRTSDTNFDGPNTYVLEGSHLILECLDKMVLFGDNRIDCLPGGTLTYEGQRCGDTCTYSSSDFVYSVLTDLNGNSIFSPIMDQEQVLLSCNNGFAFLDGTTKTELNCLNGTLGFIPQCFRYCVIPNIPFLQIDNQNSMFFEGNAVIVSCTETHEYNISTESVHCCESNGIIQPPIGHCRRKCVVQNVDHGHFESSHSSSVLHPGSTVLLENDAIILQCDNNYQSEQTQIYSICLSDGNFSPNQACLRECVIPLRNDSSFEIASYRNDIFEMRPTESELLTLSCHEDLLTCDGTSNSCGSSIALSCTQDGTMEDFCCKEKCDLSHFVPEISNGEYIMNEATVSWPVVYGDSFAATCAAGYTMKEQSKQNLTCYGREIQCVSHCLQEPEKAVLFASNPSESAAVILFSPSLNGDIVAAVHNSQFVERTVFVNGARSRANVMLIDGMSFEMYSYNIETMSFINEEPKVLDWSIDQADTMSSTCDSFLFCGGYGDCHACTLIHHDGTMQSSPTDNLRMNSCRRHGCSATASNGDVYIFGGQDLTDRALSSVEVYSSSDSSPKISQLSVDMPNGLSYCRAVEHQRMIIVCGIEIQDLCYILDTNENTFINVSSFVNERKMFEIVSLQEELYVLFGKKANGECEDTIEKLAENSGSYTWEIYHQNSQICMGDFIAIGV